MTGPRHKKVGRPTTGKRPMTDAERQRRHRARAKVTRKQLRGLDAYPSDPRLLERLLDAEPGLLPGSVSEPCCGAGALSQLLLARGHRVLSSDVADYGCPDQHLADFLEMTTTTAESICTNPPFKNDMGATFTRHALSLRPAVPIVMLLPLQILVGKSRADLHAWLVRCWLFRRRPDRMHRLDHAGPRASAQLDVGWFQFHAEHEGPATVRWL